MFAVNSNQPQAQAGPDLEEIQTEAVGFLSIAGETKLRLLPSPWPSDALPRPTATLFSIASRTELVAAAGPDTLVIATTSAVREAYERDAPVDNNVKQFTPQLSISVPRVSHIAFTSDEAFLVICADEGGGLQVYDVTEIKNGNTNPAFQLATNGVAVRALVPNPAPENGHVVALVLNDGKLMLADLKSRNFVTGKNGMILKEGVSCLSWSAKGKQLVAGLGNCTAVQMDPSGDVKAEIPRPPQVQDDQHVSGISWLANDLFWIIYTPSNFEMDHVPDSIFMLVTRQPKTTNFQFQKMMEPCAPFGMKRTPPHHFNVRLRDFPPNLSDVLVVASTASGDVGLITNSKTPLSQESGHTANIYTTTSMAVDSRRAQLPVVDDMTLDTQDTSPIGMAWDLSSKQPVKRPIPAEEIEATSTPLPALMVLNNDGILSTWWFVYNESVRQGIVYPGLIAASSGQPSTQTQPPQPSGFAAFGQSQTSQGGFGHSQTSQSAFGQSNGTSSGAFSQSAAPAFGAPAFGAPSSLGNNQGSKIPVSSFGSSSALSANKQSPWGPTNNQASAQAGSAFGKPAFGSASQLGGAAFGSSGGLGQKSSPWGGNAAAPSPFGGNVNSDNKQSTFGGNTSAASPFATIGGNNNSTSSGFGNTSSASPFGNVANGNNNKSFGSFGGGNSSSASPFATFGQAAAKPSAFGGNANQSTFGQAAEKPSIFGGSANQSTFDAPSTIGQQSTPFGAPAQQTSNVFGTPARPNLIAQESPEADMTDETPVEAQTPQEQPPNKQTSIFGSGIPGFQLGSSFKGDGSAKEDQLKPKPAGPSLFGSAFGSALSSTQTSETQNAPAPTTPIKEEPKSPHRIQVSSTTPPSPPRTGAAPPSSGGFVQGAGELKPFVPPTRSALSDITPKQGSSDTAEPPLPPSPTSHKHLYNAEPAPLPSSPQSDAPVEHAELSPAGSPPVDLGAPGSPSLSPAESVRSDEIAAAKAEEEEAPMPPDFLSKPTSIPKPTWSFSNTTPSKDKRPASPDAADSPTPGPSDTPLSLAPTQASETPISAIKPPFSFQPSPASGQSPRSPSPTRPNRFAQTPSGLLTPKPPQQTQLFSTTPMGPPPTKSQPSASATSSTSRQPPTPRQPSRLASVQQAQPEAPSEPEVLLDDEDQRIREELSEPVEPTKQLAPFLAHQDYVGKVGGQGVPAQIEKVYRDINSMIDTLGLNARSLASFIKGHDELYPDGGRDRGDLEDDDDWCLMEIEDLGVVQKEMLEQMENERPQAPRELLIELQDMQHELSKLRSRHHGLQKFISSRQSKHASARDESLSTEQSTVLSDLRKEFVGFQQLLASSEESVSLLKARLAAVQQANSSIQGPGVPTVEAVVSTIAKMTRMIEQKSGDVDLLEAQMKKLKFKPLARGARAGTPTALDEALGRLSLGSANGGRGESPFQTPPSTRSKVGASRGTFALTYSPDTSDDGNDTFRDSFRSSVGAGKGKMRLARVGEEDVKAYTIKQERKKKVMQLLKEKVTQRGPRESRSTEA